MDYKLDSHMHTVASGHAYNTIMEMAKAAADKKLELVAVTEHSVNMPGTCQLFYFMNLKMVPRQLFGIEVLQGAELNITDYKGSTDLPMEIQNKLDVCIASLHLPCITPGSMKENTAALLGVMENPCVSIIGHPDDGRYPIDYRELARAAAERHILLEVNNHSLDPVSSRTGARENLAVMLKWCETFGTYVILNSDAHWCGDIGDRRFSGPLLEEMCFPEELVVNRDVALYRSFLK